MNFETCGCIFHGEMDLTILFFPPRTEHILRKKESFQERNFYTFEVEVV